MTAIHSWLSQPIVQRIGWALIHFLWQGAAVALLLTLALLLLRRRSAIARYAACCGALLVMAACAVVTVWVTPSPSTALMPDVSAPVEPAAQFTAPGERPVPLAGGLAPAVQDRSPPPSGFFLTALLASDRMGAASGWGCRTPSS